MANRWQRWMWVSGISAALGISSLGFAQTLDGNARKSGSLFGSNTPDTTLIVSEQNTQRALEIQIELAWLADPLTYPYHLEARVRGSEVDVRGTVSGRKAHDEALNIAQLQSPFAIADHIRETAAANVTALPMPHAQLQSTIQTTLREQFPRQARNLQAQCGADGAVIITGTVNSLEEKLSVSKAMRRLHGCTSVSNMTRLQGSDEIISTRPSRINTVKPKPPEKTNAQPGGGLLSRVSKPGPIEKGGSEATDSKSLEKTITPSSGGLFSRLSKPAPAGKSDSEVVEWKSAEKFNTPSSGGPFNRLSKPAPVEKSTIETIEFKSADKTSTQSSGGLFNRLSKPAPVEKSTIETSEFKSADKTSTPSGGGLLSRLSKPAPVEKSTIETIESRSAEKISTPSSGGLFNRLSKPAPIEKSSPETIEHKSTEKTSTPSSGGLLSRLQKSPPPDKSASAATEKKAPEPSKMLTAPGGPIQLISASEAKKLSAESPSAGESNINRAAPTVWRKPNGSYETVGSVSVESPAPPQPKLAASPPAGVNAAPQTNSAPPASKPRPEIMPPGIHALAVMRLKKAIEGACPGARDVKVTFTSATAAKIEIRPRAGDDLTQVVGRILSLRELDRIEPEIVLLESGQK